MSINKMWAVSSSFPLPQIGSPVFNCLCCILLTVIEKNWQVAIKTIPAHVFKLSCLKDTATEVGWSIGNPDRFIGWVIATHWLWNWINERSCATMLPPLLPSWICKINRNFSEIYFGRWFLQIKSHVTLGASWTL